MSVSGTDAGGNGLAHIDLLVQVDGGPAHAFARLDGASGTATFEALMDGRSHTYHFTSRGVDVNGTTEPVRDRSRRRCHVAGDVRANVPTVPVGLVVQHGEAERSFVNEVDLEFNRAQGLDALVAGGHVHLTRYALDGRGASPFPLAGLLHVVDHAIEIDFGAAGVGGKPDSTAADGRMRSPSTARTRGSSFAASSATSTATAR